MVYFIVFILALFIIGIITSDPDSDYDDYSSSSTTVDAASYQHEDFWGDYGGRTIIKDGGSRAEHTDFWGNPGGYSQVEGDKIQHYTLLGSYDGYSVKNGETVDHYTECGLWKGSSVKTKDGYSHRDVFGNETSRSRKES